MKYRCDSCGDWYSNITVHEGYDLCWKCLLDMPRSLQRAWRGLLRFVFFLIVLFGLVLFSGLLVIHYLIVWPR